MNEQPYAVLTAGRAAGQLSSALYAGDMTFNQAALSARVDYELDMDDAEWVIDRLRETVNIEQDAAEKEPNPCASSA